MTQGHSALVLLLLLLQLLPSCKLHVASDINQLMYTEECARSASQLNDDGHSWLK